MFGYPDFEDEDVSPDIRDPDANEEIINGNTGENGEEVVASNGVANSLWDRITPTERKAFPTVEENLAWRLFNSDVRKLLSMKSLWENRPERKQPSPLEAEALAGGVNHPGLDGAEGKSEGLRDQRKLDIHGWLSLFMSSSRALRKRIGLKEGKYNALSWDKVSVHSFGN